MDKKKIFISIIVTILLVLAIILLLNIFGKKELKCIYNNNKLKIINNIVIGKDIIINTSYNNVYESMDEVVDTYDGYNAYFKIISKYNGIKTNLEQNEYTLKYNIEINLNEIEKESYEVSDIKEIKDFKKLKQFKEYYEKLNYICE